MAYKQCKAKCKQSGKRCKNSVTPGKEVCYKHGGYSPGGKKGNKQAVKHGFYSDALTTEERGHYERLLAKPNTLDEHIALMEVKVHRYAQHNLPGWSFDDWKSEIRQEFETKMKLPGAKEGDKPQKVRIQKTTHKPVGPDILCKMLDVLTSMYWRRHQIFMDGQGDADDDEIKFVKSPFPMPDNPG